MDKTCFERGCACYDYRDGDPVEVMRKEWVDLTDEEAGWCVALTLTETIQRVRDKLKEKNA